MKRHRVFLAIVMLAWGMALWGRASADGPDYLPRDGSLPMTGSLSLPRNTSYPPFVSNGLIKFGGESGVWMGLVDTGGGSNSYGLRIFPKGGTGTVFTDMVPGTTNGTAVYAAWAGPNDEGSIADNNVIQFGADAGGFEIRSQAWNTTGGTEGAVHRNLAIYTTTGLGAQMRLDRFMEFDFSHGKYISIGAGLALAWGEAGGNELALRQTRRTTDSNVLTLQPQSGAAKEVGFTLRPLGTSKVASQEVQRDDSDTDYVKQVIRSTSAQFELRQFTAGTGTYQDLAVFSGPTRALVVEADGSGITLDRPIDFNGWEAQNLKLEGQYIIPPCDIGSRGAIFVLPGVVGVADKLMICLKDAQNLYAFREK